MTDFKLLGGTDPANNQLGEMTQGLGYPLRKVDAAASGGTVTVRTENVLDTASFVDQDPSGLGVVTQIAFGAAQATDEWSIDDFGTATCLVTDEYNIRLKVTFGRAGNGGVAQLYMRLKINGVPTGNTIHTIVDTQRVEMPQIMQGVLPMNAGDTVEFEMVRDTDGTNAGGLAAGIPDVVGWAESPSAYLQITRTYVVEL